MDGSLTVNMWRNEPPFFFGGVVLSGRSEGELGPLELEASDDSLADAGKEQEAEWLGEVGAADAFREDMSVGPAVSEPCALVVSDDGVRYNSLGMCGWNCLCWFV